MGSLIGKRALVTGASQGIGHAVARALLRAGCDVAVHHHGPHADADADRALAGSLGRRVWHLQADLTQEAAAADLVDRAVDRLGGLDVLVNNTGGLVARRTLESVDPAYWQQVIDLNLSTAMWVTRRCLAPLAAADGASIVNVASLAGRKGGHAGSLAYSMAKGALLTFTRSLAVEVAPRGIRVNAVAPGLILGTRFHDTHTTPESARATVAGIPLGRAGDVDDVARPVVFLASEHDGFITGATLDINGGVYCA